MKQEYKGIIYYLSEDNCCIEQSYLIRSRAVMEDFCANVLPESFLKARTINSYVAEWRAHNLLYNLHLFVKHTVETDLNPNESLLRRFFFRILSLFYRGK